ncbi:MAG: hemerythrin domain-containing protein [Pseudobdellovibrio sp.]
MLFASQAIKVLTEDHYKLRKEIEILKKIDIPITERRVAFSRLLPRLTIHTKSEERVIYAFMKLSGEEDLQMWSVEGKEEHILIDQLVKKMLTENVSSEEWSAKGKVLAELVEHHLNEEENEIFPILKSEISDDVDADLRERYETEKINVSRSDEFHQKPSISSNPI